MQFVYISNLCIKEVKVFFLQNSCIYHQFIIGFMTVFTVFLTLLFSFWEREKEFTIFTLNKTQEHDKENAFNFGYALEKQHAIPYI